MEFVEMNNVVADRIISKIPSNQSDLDLNFDAGWYRGFSRARAYNWRGGGCLP
jgi:hypothetical protein